MDRCQTSFPRAAFLDRAHRRLAPAAIGAATLSPTVFLSIAGSATPKIRWPLSRLQAPSHGPASFSKPPEMPPPLLAGPITSRHQVVLPPRPFTASSPATTAREPLSPLPALARSPSRRLQPETLPSAAAAKSPPMLAIALLQATAGPSPLHLSHRRRSICDFSHFRSCSPPLLSPSQPDNAARLRLPRIRRIFLAATCCREPPLPHRAAINAAWDLHVASLPLLCLPHHRLPPPSRSGHLPQSLTPTAPSPARSTFEPPLTAVLPLNHAAILSISITSEPPILPMPAFSSSPPLCHKPLPLPRRGHPPTVLFFFLSFLSPSQCHHLSSIHPH